MPEIPDVAPGETIQVSWGNPIRSRTVLRYPNAAARDVSVSVPVSGDVAWLVDVSRVTVYDGTDWQIVGPAEGLPPAVSLVGVDLTLTQSAGVDERIGLLSNIDTATFRWLVTVSGTVEAALTAASTWIFTLRSLQPSTTVMQVVTDRDSVGEAVYRSSVSLHGLSSASSAVNEMELLASRSIVSGTHIMRDFNFSAVPVKRI